MGCNNNRYGGGGGMESVYATHKSFNFGICLMRDLNIIDHLGENRKVHKHTSSTKGKPTNTELVHRHTCI